MQGASNRSAIIISGLLTLLLLIGATLGLGIRNGWVQIASDTPVTGAVTPRPQPDVPGTRSVAVPAPGTQLEIPATATEGEALRDRRKLAEAYRALDEAYAQIRSLQASQPQLASRRDDHDDEDDDHRDRRSRRRPSENN